MKPWEFEQKQSLPYDEKIAHAEQKAWEFYNRLNRQSQSVYL